MVKRSRTKLVRRAIPTRSQRWLIGLLDGFLKAIPRANLVLWKFEGISWGNILIFCFVNCKRYGIILCAQKFDERATKVHAQAQNLTKPTPICSSSNMCSEAPFKLYDSDRIRIRYSLSPIYRKALQISTSYLLKNIKILFPCSTPLVLKLLRHLC